MEFAERKPTLFLDRKQRLHKKWANEPKIKNEDVNSKFSDIPGTMGVMSCPKDVLFEGNVCDKIELRLISNHFLA